MGLIASFRGIPAAAGLRVVRDARVRELLIWCAPALALGAIARACVLYHFPYGYVHPDSQDFLTTASNLLRRHRFVLHAKKAYLIPILYALPVLFKVPCLIVVPWVQHGMGLIETVMVGALVRLWTRFWKMWIIPATVAATLNPAMLWYEHTLIAEFPYLWCVTALALVGTMCALRPGRWTFGLLIVALLLTAGSRPEGKLFGLFCILIAAQINWGGWRMRALYCGIAVAASVLSWFSCRDSEGGLLLYATVLPLAPDTPRSAPRFGLMIEPLREQAIAEGPVYLTDLVGAVLRITPVAVDYLKSMHQRPASYAEFCQRLAIEAALRAPWSLPTIALDKFLLGFKFPTSGDFGEHWMQEMQIKSCTDKDWMAPLIPRLAGPGLQLPPDVLVETEGRRGSKMSPEMTGQLKAAISSFIQKEYRPLDASNPFKEIQWLWAGMTAKGGVGEQHAKWGTVPGIPPFFIAGAAGMILSLFRGGPLRKMHRAWVAQIVCVAAIVMLTGVVNARYRFVFEPFFLLYIFALLDFVSSLIFQPKPSDAGIS